MAVHEVFAYLCVDGADAAIRFYREAFGATEKFRLVEPGGRVGHAELDFDGATLMLADEFPEIGVRGPGNLGGSPVTIHPHCGRLRRRGRACVRRRPARRWRRRPPTQFYGERSAVLKDPSGHRWNVGHEIEEVSPREMQRRFDEMVKGG